MLELLTLKDLEGGRFSLAVSKSRTVCIFEVGPLGTDKHLCKHASGIVMIMHTTLRFLISTQRCMLND